MPRYNAKNRVKKHPLIVRPRLTDDSRGQGLGRRARVRIFLLSCYKVAVGQREINLGI